MGIQTTSLTPRKPRRADGRGSLFEKSRNTKPLTRNAKLSLTPMLSLHLPDRRPLRSKSH